MSYYEVKAKINPTIPGNDVVITLLGEIGFESFVENEDGVLAYVQEDQFNEALIKEQLASLNETGIDVAFEISKVADQNWNEEWEKNYEPVIIDTRCVVKAPFHTFDTKFDYEIMIQPKMSFGTGHHETTTLMLEQLLELELKGKSLLDMGCGTSVLAILAAMRGASPIDAIDNDEWAYNNSIENIEVNGTPDINVMLGDASLLKGQKYDIIVANINRNILLKDMESYAKSMKVGSILLLSGFFLTDVDMLVSKCNEFGIELDLKNSRNNWTMLKLIKKVD